MNMHAGSLSDAEKRSLKRDGFIILKNAVPRNLISTAKELIYRDPTQIVHGDIPAINNLYNESALREIMLKAMGPHTAPINAQVAVTLPHSSDAVIRRPASATYYPQAHVDGGWAGL